MLAAAGLDCIVHPSDVDETRIKEAMRRDGRSAEDTALALADAKALNVSAHHPGAWVVGADQMLRCEDRWFDKPADPDEARSNLQWLSGRRHQLHAAVSVARNGAIAWSVCETAHLTMRSLSDPFLDRYLAAMGGDALRSVGSYEIEGLGAQLFSRVEGDTFVIMGLPLLPLLDFFRQAGVLTT